MSLGRSLVLLRRLAERPADVASLLRNPAR